MQIFSMDTSSAAASCALLEDDRPIAQFSPDARLTPSPPIMPMAQALLECSHKSVQDIDLFAVSVGPGSFTGLRIGVAAVKGMAQVLQKPCVPVSALEGLAFNLYDRAGILCAALDARCGQVYAACFDADNQMARLTDDSALMAEELCEQLSQLPAGRPITVLGDGAQLVADTMQRLYPQRKLSIPGKHLLLQHAYGVGLAALHGIQSGRVQPILAEQLEPVYLKLPQAQRELMAKQAKQAAAQPKK